MSSESVEIKWGRGWDLQPYGNLIAFSLYAKRAGAEDEGWSLLCSSKSRRFLVVEIDEQRLRPGEMLHFYVSVETGDLTLQGDAGEFERSKSYLTSEVLDW